MGGAAVFLDRDGVLNEVRMEGSIASTPRGVEELRVPTTTRGELERLRSAGFRLLVVSNQPDVARGELTITTLNEINAALAKALPIDAVYCCVHDSNDGCACRKPAAGLILQGAREWGIDLTASFLIGDRWVDMAAAKAVGVAGVLLRRPWSWSPTSIGGPPQDLRPRYEGTTLSECVAHVLAKAGASSHRAS